MVHVWNDIFPFVYYNRPSPFGLLWEEGGLCGRASRSEDDNAGHMEVGNAPRSRCSGQIRLVHAIVDQIRYKCSWPGMKGVEKRQGDLVTKERVGIKNSLDNFGTELFPRIRGGGLRVERPIARGQDDDCARETR